MSRRVSLLCALPLTIGFAAAALVLMQRPSASSRSPLSGIEIGVDDVNLGNVVESTAHEHVVRLQNSSSIPVELSLEASCQCSSITPHEIHLAPRASKQVRLTIKLSPPPPQFGGQLEWPFGLNLIATAKGASGRTYSRRWHLDATVQRALAAQPAVLRLSGASDVIQGETASAIARLLSASPFSEVRARVASGSGSVNVRQDSDGHIISYTIADSKEAGEFTAEIHVTAITATGDELPELVIPIVGRVVPEFRATPEVIVLPPGLVGTRSEQLTAISSARGTPFRVDLPESALDGLSIKLLERNDQAAPQQIRISTQITAEGNHAWELPLRIVPTEGAPCVLKFTVRAYGISDRRTATAVEGSR